MADALLLPNGRIVRRVQLRRTKDWRLPEGAIKVDRSTRWGNPFKVGSDHPWYPPGHAIMHPEDAVDFYEAAIEGRHPWPEGWRFPRPTVEEIRANLAGHDLACWCHESFPCHVGPLLSIANPDGVEVTS